MTDNTDGFDTGIGIEEETGPESGMPSEGPDMTRDRPSGFFVMRFTVGSSS